MEWLQSGFEWFLNYFFEDGFSLWIIIGLTGTVLFGSRFIVQWLVSEYKGESVIPVSFWYLSIVGSLCLLFYALFYRRDLIFTLGYLPNCLIYGRNLYLIHKKKVETEVKVETPDTTVSDAATAQPDEAPPRDTP